MVTHESGARMRARPAIDAEAVTPLEIVVDAGCPLAALSSSVDALCSAVDEAASPPAVLVRLTPIDPSTRHWPGDVDVQDVSRWERALRRYERLPALTICAVTGACGGPALALLLASDYRIATPDSALSLPVNDDQLWPGMELYRLVKQVGLGRARELLLSRGPIPIERAATLGLVDTIAATLELRPTTLPSAAAGSELAIRRQLLLEATSASYEDALGVHLAACDREIRRLAHADRT